MRSRKDRIDTIEGLLRSAWKGAPRKEPGERWHDGVMREIRSLPVPGRSYGFFESQASIVWRFSAAAAVITLFFVIYALSADITSYRDIAMMLLEDPAGFVLSPPFG